MIQLTDDLTLVRGYNMVYLASPYTKYPRGIYNAAYDISRIAGDLLNDGINVFSPVVHSHYIAMLSGMDPLDHDLWMRIDRGFMNNADVLLVCQMTGWEESRGVEEEIKFFEHHKKPVFGFQPKHYR